MLDAVLVSNSVGEWYRFQLWEDRYFIMNRRDEYRNYEDWDSAWLETDIEEIHALYVKYFGKAAPKNAKKKTLTKAIWAKWFYMSQDRTGTYNTSGVKNHVTGERDRKRNLDGRRYRVLDGGNSEHLQEQALITYRELKKFQQAAGTETISEANVRTVMEQAQKSGLLKTKQDPFRIFQYYRGALIKCGKLEMFK